MRQLREWKKKIPSRIKYMGYTVSHMLGPLGQSKHDSTLGTQFQYPRTSCAITRASRPSVHCEIQFRRRSCPLNHTVGFPWCGYMENEERNNANCLLCFACDPPTLLSVILTNSPITLPEGLPCYKWRMEVKMEVLMGRIHQRKHNNHHLRVPTEWNGINWHQTFFFEIQTRHLGFLCPPHDKRERIIRHISPPAEFCKRGV